MVFFIEKINKFGYHFLLCNRCHVYLLVKKNRGNFDPFWWCNLPKADFFGPHAVFNLTTEWPPWHETLHAHEKVFLCTWGCIILHLHRYLPQQSSKDWLRKSKSNPKWLGVLPWIKGRDHSTSRPLSIVKIAHKLY